jgi:DNA N-6-adenine-methyltransferase (Dam)
VNRKTPMLAADDVRETPADKFAELSKLVGGFTLDVCATTQNAKCQTCYTLGGLMQRTTLGDVWLRTADVRDGLAGSWAGERCWCNPPFSTIGDWVEKAWRSPDAELVAMLVPATRTEQPWWHRWIEPWRDGRGGYPQELRQHGFAPPDWHLSTVFLQGRWHFLKDGAPILNPATGKRSAPKFGCCLLLWSHPR